MKRYDTDLAAGLVITASRGGRLAARNVATSRQAADAAPFTYLMPRFC
jgi:hypothetical protein